MIGNMSRRERALVGLSILAGSLILGWEFVVQPIRDRYVTAAELVPVREQVLARRMELVGRKAIIARDLEATN